MSKKRLKGFTLVELIVVIAVFGLLIAATLSFIEPTRKIFKNTQEQASNTLLIDNVQRSVADNIRFANRMVVNLGPIDPAASEADIETYARNQANALRNTFCIGNGNPDRTRVEYAKDTVYVMRVNNPENFDNSSSSAVQFAANSDDPPGKVSLWKFDGGVMSGSSREWMITKGEYGDVSFSLSFAGVETEAVEIGNYDKRELINKLTYNDAGTWVSPSNFRMNLDIYTNRYNSDRTRYDICRTGANVTIPLALVNMAAAGTLSSDNFQYRDSGSTDVKKLAEADVPARYDFHNIGLSNDIYFIYTLPEFGS